MLPKNLKKIAAECRKAGIKSYKCADFEFTLTDDAPVSNYKKKQTKKLPLSTAIGSEPFLSDTLSEEELLFWSTGAPSETEPTQE